MALDDFLRKWEETSRVAQIVKGLSESREDSEAFGEHYEDLRKEDIGENPELFPDYVPESPDAINTQERILVQAGILARANLEDSYRYSRKNLKGVLEELRAKVRDGKLDDKLIGIVASVEPKAKNPFSDAVRAYREAANPISGEKPDFDTIRKKLGEKLDSILSGNEKERIYAKLANEMYRRNENLAITSYVEYFVKPQQAKLKNAIASKDSSWMTDVAESVNALKKGEKIKFYTGLCGLANEAA